MKPDRRQKTILCRKWPTLGVEEMPEIPLEIQVMQVARRLELGIQPDDIERERAAHWLRQVLSTKRGREALREKSPATEWHVDMTIDYLVQRELLGKELAARIDVARAWRLTPDGVKSIVTKKCREYAAARLAWLLGALGDDTRDRRHILECISRDLRRWHGVNFKDH